MASSAVSPASSFGTDHGPWVVVGDRGRWVGVCLRWHPPFDFHLHGLELFFDETDDLRHINTLLGAWDVGWYLV